MPYGEARDIVGQVADLRRHLERAFPVETVDPALEELIEALDRVPATPAPQPSAGASGRR